MSLSAAYEHKVSVSNQL